MICTDRRSLDYALYERNNGGNVKKDQIGLLRMRGPGVPTWPQVNEAMEDLGSQDKIDWMVWLWRGSSTSTFVEFPP